MVGIFRVIFCYWLTLGIFYIWLTVGELPCHFGKLLINHICLFLVTHLWIQIENCYYLRIAIIGGEFPGNLNDGTVNLYAKEVFGSPCYADCCLECDSAVNVRHGSCTDISISVPRATAIPREIESGLTVLHDGRNTVVVIG